MKTNVIKIGLIFLLSMLMIQPTFSQNQEKKIKKEVKQKVKEYKGWKVSGTLMSMEGAFTNYYEELYKKPDDNHELYASVKNCPSEELGLQAGIAWAQNRYATLAKNFVKGFIASNSEFAEIEKSDATNNFYNMYYQLVDKDMSYLLLSSKSVVLKKETGGKVTLNLFYIINEDKAKEMREKAYDQSQKELEKLKIQQDKMKNIKDQVDKAFSIPNTDNDATKDFIDAK
jgi:hypothetical protein